MHRIPILRVALVRERATIPAPTRMITGPLDAHAIFAEHLADRDRETFVVMLIDTRHRVIGVNVVSIGTLNSSLVHPREVFKPALLANAAAVILAHNHPSGEADPSPEDLAITARLKQAGELLGVPVLDHLVIGDQCYVSLKERNLL